MAVGGKCEMSSSISFDDEDILLGVVAHKFQRTERSMWVLEITLKRGAVVEEYFHLFPDLHNDEKKIFLYFSTLAEKLLELVEFLPFKKKDTRKKWLTATPSSLTKRNHSPP